MRLDEMKRNIPETPEFIHKMIQNEVEEQLRNTRTVNAAFSRKSRKRKTVIAAAACVASFTVVAYAGTKWCQMHLEKNDAYRVSTKIEADMDTENVKLPQELHEIGYEADYIPEGMVWTDEYHLAYETAPYTGGFSFSSVVLDQDDMDLVKQDTYVLDSEERTFGEYEGIYLQYHQYQKSGFDKRIYLLCPDLYRVVIIHIGEDVSKEDAIKVIENLSITEKEETFFTENAYSWSQVISPLEEGTTRELLTEISKDEVKIFETGETFDLPVSWAEEDGDLVDQTISVCVDAVSVSDDLSLLEETYLPSEWKESVDSDGTLRENMLSYIKSGDGIETLDEVVRTETVKRKLVCADVTYTNDSDRAITHMLFMGSLVQMQQEDGLYKICDGTVSGEDYDRITCDEITSTHEMEYYDTREEFGNGGNYISSLGAGESKTVRMAWILNETDLDNLYLNLSGEGAHSEFTEIMLDTGLVDIHK